MSMPLSELLEQAGVPAGAGFERADTVMIEDITLDSRAAGPGSLFFALGGGSTHGLQFAAGAVERGARAILWDPETAPAGVMPPVASERLCVLAVPGLARRVGAIADRFFDSPSRHLRVVGITGTNGKTTSAYLLAQCVRRLGDDAAYVGTLGWGRIDALQAATHTTPDVVSLHRQLAALRALGVRTVAMEVSSHALDQGRIDGVQLHTAAFTNLSRDHLDYHETMEAYGEAKARLFDAPALATRVLNVGDDFGRGLAARPTTANTTIRVWVDGERVRPPAATDGDARSLYATEVSTLRSGLVLDVAGSFGNRHIGTRLLGRFNAENSLIVLACLCSLGASLDAAAAALSSCDPPPGRLEIVAGAAPERPLAVIDYAHTPDALAKALGVLREHCEGALWCVFGCGGDRDAGKRPLMGAIADRLADRIIVTDDNPRSEDPAAITAAIVAAIESRAARVIHDRGAAIATALDEAVGGDLVLIAGKGHEDYQIYGATRRDFSDRLEARRHLGVAA